MSAIPKSFDLAMPALPPSAALPPLYSAGDLARYYDITPDSARHWMRSMSTVNVPGQRCRSVTESAVAEWIAKNSEPAKSARRDARIPLDRQLTDISAAVLGKLVQDRVVRVIRLHQAEDSGQETEGGAA